MLNGTTKIMINGVYSDLESAFSIPKEFKTIGHDADNITAQVFRHEIPVETVVTEMVLTGLVSGTTFNVVFSDYLPVKGLTQSQSDSVLGDLSVGDVLQGTRERFEITTLTPMDEVSFPEYMYSVTVVKGKNSFFVLPDSGLYLSVL